MYIFCYNQFGCVDILSGVPPEQVRSSAPLHSVTKGGRAESGSVVFRFVPPQIFHL
jgi:hypothetical protein